MLSMYELVGDKLQEIFDAQVVDIGLFDLEQGADPLSLRDRARRALSRCAESIDRSRPLAGRRTEAVVINDTDIWAAELGIEMIIQQGEASEVNGVRSAHRAGKGIGQISLQNLDRTNAFTESDTRLLMTLARPQRRARDRPPLRRNATAADRNQRARRRAGRSSTASSRALPPSSTCRRCTTSWATRSARSSTPRSSTSAATTSTNELTHFEYVDRARCALPRHRWPPSQVYREVMDQEPSPGPHRRCRASGKTRLGIEFARRGRSCEVDVLAFR